MTSTIEKSSIRSTQGIRPTPQPDARHAEARQAELVWTQMGDGVWVAKRDSDFAGLIEELWGAGYRVTDRYGAIIGEFATFQSARRHLE